MPDNGGTAEDAGGIASQRTEQKSRMPDAAEIVIGHYASPDFLPTTAGLLC
jgi:hypothetical protein